MPTALNVGSECTASPHPLRYVGLVVMEARSELRYEKTMSACRDVGRCDADRRAEFDQERGLRA